MKLESIQSKLGSVFFTILVVIDIRVEMSKFFPTKQHSRICFDFAGLVWRSLIFTTVNGVVRDPLQS